jgi:uncharacterized membrane protein
MMPLHKERQEKDAPSATQATPMLHEHMIQKKLDDGPTQQTEARRAPFSMNAAIGWILQGGVLISSAVICLGVVLWFVRSNLHSSQQFLVFPHTLGEIGSGLLMFHAQSVIALGLLLLLITPVVRVAASIVAFGLEHDRRYVLITTIVLGVLMLSFLLGKGAG